MSWTIFKERMIQTGRNQRSSSIENYAKSFVREYDSCIKRGADSLNQVALQRGNVDLMEQFVIQILTAQQRNASQTDLLKNLGISVTLYWTGGIMSPFPIPLLPAPGSVQNVSVINNVIISPGQWPPSPPIFPTRNENGFIDPFISLGRAHLATISGLITTTSLYPPLGTPGPGIIPWTGYTVP